MESKVRSVQTTLPLLLATASLVAMTACNSPSRSEAPTGASGQPGQSKTQPQPSPTAVGSDQTGDQDPTEPHPTKEHHRKPGKPKEEKPKEPKEEDEQPALTMALYRGKGNSSLPDSESQVAGDWFSKASVGPDGIRLAGLLPLSDPSKGETRIFLAISDSLGSEKIQDATYERKVKNPNGDIRDGSPRSLASYDPDLHAFFIPLDELFKDEKFGPNPLDLQILKLQLRVGNGNREAEVQFSTASILPELKEVMTPRAVPGLGFQQPDRGTVINQVRNGVANGFLVASETYSNPTSRPLALWFGIKKMKLRVETSLGMHLLWGQVPGLDSHKQPYFESDRRETSRFGMDQISIAVTQIGKKPETKSTLDLGNVEGDRKMVLIAPGDSIQVDWLASGASVPDTCADGAPDIRGVFRCYNGSDQSIFVRAPDEHCARESFLSMRNTVGGTRDDLEQALYQSLASNPIYIPADWEVNGYGLTGDLRREVDLAEAVDTLEHASSVGMSKALITQDAPTQSVPANDPLAGSLSYACQGIF